MRKPAEIIIALGTNKAQEANMSAARELVAQLLPGLTFTRDLWTAPVGIESDLFLNCLASGTTSLSYAEARSALKLIESQLGAEPSSKAAGIVAIDLDILLFNGRRYHQKDWNRTYIKQLLSELKTTIAL